MNILAPLATLAAPDADQITSRARAALTMVESMTIDSAETYELAADELKAIKTRSKSLEDQRTSITGPINQALKAVNDLFRGPADYLNKAESIIKSKMITYSEEQKRIAEEERRKAEALIRAEQERLAKEAAEKEAQAAAEAQRLIEAGDVEKAAEVQAQATIEAASLAATAQVMTAPAVQTNVPKASGISTRSVWKAEVVSKSAMIKFIASNPQFEHLLDVNTSAANQLAKALKESMSIPGLKAVEEKTMAASRI
jgi:colicin import membrane protein